MPTITSSHRRQLLREDSEVGGELLARLGGERRRARAGRIDGEVDPARPPAARRRSTLRRIVELCLGRRRLARQPLRGDPDGGEARPAGTASSSPWRRRGRVPGRRPRRRRSDIAGPPASADGAKASTAAMREKAAATCGGYARRRGRIGSRAARDAPAQPGRLPLSRRGRRRPLRRQGEVAARPGAQLFQPAATAATGSSGWSSGSRRVEVIVTSSRGGGAAPRAEPRQAPPAAVQRPAARRQVVPVHRRHGGGRVPAGDVHARAAPARHRLLRPVREREEGARDARRAQPRVPVPAVRGPEARPPLRHPVPRLPHRALHCAVHRGDLARRTTGRRSTA